MVLTKEQYATNQLNFFLEREIKLGIMIDKQPATVSGLRNKNILKGKIIEDCRNRIRLVERYSGEDTILSKKRLKELETKLEEWLSVGY